jgi:hypothetical protein
MYVSLGYHAINGHQWRDVILTPHQVNRRESLLVRADLRTWRIILKYEVRFLLSVSIRREGFSRTSALQELVRRIVLFFLPLFLGNFWRGEESH